MSQRVLVIEEEPILNHSLVARLVAEGFAAEGVGSADDARKALDAADRDLLILDTQLPDSHGLGLLHAVKERRPGQLVLVTTARSSIEEAVAAIKLGAQDYLVKPFDVEELLARIRKVLETPLAPAAERATAAPSLFALPRGGVNLEALERELVLQAIAATKGNKSKAGRLLGLNRDQIRYRLDKYGITEGAGAKNP